MPREIDEMAHSAEAAVIPPRNELSKCSPAAERMRRYRERQRDGLRCLIIELRETEIDTLARNGFLKADARNDLRAIEMALYEFLERNLV
jgi:hypothetical protein